MGFRSLGGDFKGIDTRHVKILFGESSCFSPSTPLLLLSVASSINIFFSSCLISFLFLLSVFCFLSPQTSCMHPIGSFLFYFILCACCFVGAWFSSFTMWVLMNHLVRNEIGMRELSMSCSFHVCPWSGFACLVCCHLPLAASAFANHCTLPICFSRLLQSA